MAAPADANPENSGRHFHTRQPLAHPYRPTGQHAILPVSKWDLVRWGQQAAIIELKAVDLNDAAGPPCKMMTAQMVPT
jgi:hypothetical protein